MSLQVSTMEDAMISHRLKESQEDSDVKARLWDATSRELIRFAERYAEEHVVGQRVSEAQEDVACAAAKMGYPKTLVRDLGSAARRGVMAEDRAVGMLCAYQIRIGLASGRAAS